MFRLIIAAIIGYFLGYERKKHDKSGGSRTMALICMGACLVAILSLEMSTVFDFDIMRLLQGAIQGVGFIGMGLIFKQKGQVEGLTTASVLFFVVILGFCVGLNYFFYSFLGTGVAWIILESKYWNINKKKGIK